MPVLAICILLALTSIGALMNAPSGNLPLFGFHLTGSVRTLALVALGLLFGYLAVQMFRLRPSAWWTLILLQVIGSGLSIINAQPGRPAAWWVILAAGSLADLGFLLWLRRRYRMFSG